MPIRFAAALYAALTLALAAFAGTALAGNGHGNGGNSANAPGQQKQDSVTAPPTAAPTPTAATAPATAPAKTHGNSAAAPGRTKHTSTAGVKPSSASAHGQKPTSAPASSNQTKLYGNGKTAGQIATAAGYSGTLYGPGNSQPHKAPTCKGNVVDVHALKAPGHNKCAPTPSVTSSVQAAQSMQTTAPCVATKTVTEQVGGGVDHFTGPKGSGHFVVISPSTHSAHYRDKHPDAIAPSSTVTRTVVVHSASCTAASSSSSVTATATQSSSPIATAAPASTATGSVLGAVTPLHAAAATPKATGGVLGSVVRLGRRSGGTSLPFTGAPLWLFALVAAGLILAGALARRVSAER